MMDDSETEAAQMSGYEMTVLVKNATMLTKDSEFMKLAMLKVKHPRARGRAYDPFAGRLAGRSRPSRPIFWIANPLPRWGSAWLLAWFFVWLLLGAAILDKVYFHWPV